MGAGRQGHSAGGFGMWGVVDERAVLRLRILLARDRTDGRDRTPLDLGRVEGWSRAGVAALAALLDDPPVDLDVLPPRADTFVELLRATELREIWPVYRHVRRVMTAARAQRGVERAS
ncbi:hypothetical protein PHK61_28905 [Actinomycetospora lutea]|uniref:hypothetical protein n=1 Tax=Actinomycetospora lutea TaxID=663604 RepID=UPI002366AE39|nr:hypothetical protein [Actinomycetospora lutea]MDD7942441.1 hypothetical protein [Actinomycetospora lutea]